MLHDATMLMVSAAAVVEVVAGDDVFDCEVVEVVAMVVTWAWMAFSKPPRLPLVRDRWLLSTGELMSRIICPALVQSLRLSCSESIENLDRRLSLLCYVIIVYFLILEFRLFHPKAEQLGIHSFQGKTI